MSTLSFARSEGPRPCTRPAHAAGHCTTIHGPAVGAVGASVLWQAPTLVVAECVLVYMEAAEAQALVSALAALLPSAVFAVYEQAPPSPHAPNLLACGVHPSKYILPLRSPAICS